MFGAPVDPGNLLLVGRMGDQGVRESIHRVAMLGNHLPRHCGIATFTSDLIASIRAGDERPKCRVAAIDERRILLSRRLAEVETRLARDPEAKAAAERYRASLLAKGDAYRAIGVRLDELTTRIDTVLARLREQRRIQAVLMRALDASPPERIAEVFAVEAIITDTGVGPIPILRRPI